MTRHIVLWNLKDEFTPEEKQAHAARMKAELEALKGLIEGIVDITVRTDMLPSSNRAVMLDSLFESDAALAAYIEHPEHKRVGQFVRSVVQDRASADYAE